MSYADGILIPPLSRNEKAIRQRCTGRLFCFKETPRSTPFEACGVDMSLCITIEGENGKVVEALLDEKNLLRNLLPSGSGQPHTLLDYVDPYGNTIFNRLQMNQFLSEWENVAARAHTAEEKALVAGVKALAQRCEAGVHLYLKFIGD
jgi:hypothetical protein